MTVLSSAVFPYKGNHEYVNCVCDCGSEKMVRLAHLKNNKIVSCGCYVKELNSTGRTGVEGKITNTKLHNSWRAMIGRCTDENNIGYKYYGGKGVRVCREWLEYKNFRDWSVLNGHVDGLTIDRIDSSGDYKPSNCRWVTRFENNTEMLNRHREKGTGAFSSETTQKLTEINRDGLGAKFDMYLDGEFVSEYRCLIECAKFIVQKKGLTTEPVQIKKNISACLHGKRNRCHGYTFKWREEK